MADEPQPAARFEQTTEDARRYERFLTTIRQRTGLDRDHAERAAMAVLQTLAERVPRARLEELAEDLADPLRFWLLQDATDRPEALPVEEFVRRVAEREEVDPGTAARHARAAMHAVARIAPAYELDDLVDELPHAYEPLVGDVARQVMDDSQPAVRSYDEFVERVKRRADVDRVEAERASLTVLETLAERLPGGEVDDLQAVLPERFREALERGKVHVHGRPRGMSLDEFVERVALKEEGDFDDAFTHARAVFTTLAEALPPRELRDILHGLPRGYRETLL
jgi:uncharacterized protein (DUF2267 family)